MKELSRDGYTTEEILKALRADEGTRIINFRFDILDENENKKDELTKVSAAEVTLSSGAEIKRTAKFSLEEEQAITTGTTQATIGSYYNLKLGEL